MSKVIVIRPDKENADLSDQLQALAKKKHYSLNKYLVLLLSNHIKKTNKIKPVTVGENT